VADIVLVEDEEVLRRNLAKTLERDQHDVRAAASAEEAMEMISKGPPDLLLADHNLPGMTGYELLLKLKADHPGIPVIIVTADATISDALGAMREGAADYLRKPIDLDELSLVVERCLEREGLRRELKYYRDRDLSAGEPGGIIGTSTVTQRLRTIIARLASLEKKDGVGPTILLTGETGTGKGLTARAIHNASPRNKAPFIEVNCTAIPDNLLEAELMGYERGAFTDARNSKAGLFEAAEGGTIFFDEIGHMKTHLQAKLLKIIDEKNVRRLGSTRDRIMRSTIITATHMDLEKMVREGLFLHDLYHRINVVKIELPPLRSRGDDSLLLADYFLRTHSADYGMDTPKLSDGAISAIRHHAWPGNVRELSHAIERALVLNAGPVLTERDLAITLNTDRGPTPTGAAVDTSVEIDFAKGPVRIEDIEVRMIKKAMEFTGGNQARSARLLGLSRDAFRYRLEKHGLR
jgi:two-component system response regulator AtoC